MAASAPVATRFQLYAGNDKRTFQQPWGWGSARLHSLGAARTRVVRAHICEGLFSAALAATLCSPASAGSAAAPDGIDPAQRDIRLRRSDISRIVEVLARCGLRSEQRVGRKGQRRGKSVTMETTLFAKRPSEKIPDRMERQGQKESFRRQPAGSGHPSTSGSPKLMEARRGIASPSRRKIKYVRPWLSFKFVSALPESRPTL